MTELSWKSSDMNVPTPVDLSVCIVSYNTREFLRECLDSILESQPRVSFEIIVVDNDSRDGSAEMVRSEYPSVRLIENSTNVGFTPANNQALRASKGRYVLWLNSDTVVLPGALDGLVAFADSRSDVGILGPKVLNRDGTVQRQCHRGLPTPWATFCYASGLAKLFPRSKLFGQYLMTYIDEDQILEVDAVSGACLMARRELLSEIGFPDEEYVFSVDDLDWCYRAQERGWKIYYYPQAGIIHYGGQAGSTYASPRMVYIFHQGMWLYHKRHLARRYPFFINWLVGIGIALKMARVMLFNMFRKEKLIGSKKP